MSNKKDIVIKESVDDLVQLHQAAVDHINETITENAVAQVLATLTTADEPWEVE